MHEYAEGLILGIIKEVTRATNQQILNDIKQMFKIYKEDLSISMIIKYLEQKCEVK